MCVRTSKAFYGSFILDMGRSPGFGSAYCDFRPIKTWFPFGSACPHAYPRRKTQLAGPFYKKYAVALPRVALPPVVNTGFQVLFHSPPGVLFTFPSRYCFAIGHRVVFSLGGWSPRLPTRFPVSRGTLDPARTLPLSLTGLSPSPAGFPKTVPVRFGFSLQSVTPAGKPAGLGSSAFARRY